MTSWPTVVPYVERLPGLLPAGQPAAFDVEIPTTRDDAFDAIATLHRLFAEDRPAWKATYRRLTASDWYVLGLLLSGGQRLDPFTGRVETDCDFQFNYAREMQFDSGRKLDKSSRGHFKSHWRCYVGVTNRVVVNPDLVAILVAHERQAAFKHAYRTALEWTSNAELKLAWDDVFWPDPEKESTLWNQDKGWTVRRRIAAPLPTFSYYAIKDAPTGGRVGLYVFDDVEEEGTVENDEMREQTIKRFTSYLDLAGRLPEMWVNGTHFHPNGLISHLERSGAWTVRCHQAEDLTKPPPDIAALYDACEGRMPNGEEIPPAVRKVRLDGEPVYLHPLELALKRLEKMMRPGGLAQYYMQYMGDATAGLEHKLNHEQFRFYEETPEDRAQGTNLIMTIDGSKGINDPTVALVWALHPDETCSLVAGLRRKLVPSAFGPAIYNLHSEWDGFGFFEQFRVEIFAQAAYDFMIRTYFEQRYKNCPRIIPIGHPIKNRLREFNALEPMMRRGRIWLPVPASRGGAGLMVEDETGMRYDLIDYLIDNEIKPFPLLDRDDVVAAMSLLGEPADARVQGGGKATVGPLPFPDNDSAWELQERRRRSGRPEPTRRQGGWDEGNWWGDEGELN